VSGIDPQVCITFDDILIMPSYSEVMPAQVDITTRLTRNIRLNIPLLSAAMDTVTSARTAITMAEAGGIGIIHKNLSPEDQAAEVRKVKRSITGMIVDPVTVTPNQPLQEVLDAMSLHNISGLPVVEKGTKKLVGIITHRDVRFETNLNLSVEAMMTKDLVTAQEHLPPAECKKLLHKRRIEKLLIVDKDNRLSGLVTTKDLQKSEDNPNAVKDTRGRLLVGAAIGVVESDRVKRVAALVEAGVDVIAIDTAHGHTRAVLDAVERTKKEHPNVDIIGGNVATAEGTRALINAGVDCVKVGIGPGSICTTRIVAGVGVPQVSAIVNCVDEASKSDIPIIADGGIKFSGDIVKAIAAGADTVMVGSMFAGTDESPGDIVFYQGRSYKIYRGMGSIGAMRAGSKDRYFQSTSENNKLVPEGIEGRVPHRGPLDNILYQLIGGLRAGMGYTGSADIATMRTKRTNFVRSTPQGLRESHVHDVIITEEAPNYRQEPR